MIAEIQAKIRSRCYELSRHALDQRIERAITIAELEQAFATQCIILEDYPDDKLRAELLGAWIHPAWTSATLRYELSEPSIVENDYSL